MGDAPDLEKIYIASFESNASFFPDDMQEEEGDEGDEEYSLQTAIASPELTVFSFWKDNVLIGGAVISCNADGYNILERLFILPAEQGKNYGFRAWSEIEEMLPSKKGWMLRTPTCLINNVCFYVNKCGFSVVRVEDIGNDGVGMYLFYKPVKKDNPQSDEITLQPDN